MREIYLGDGLSARVSDIDYDWLAKLRWRPHEHSASGKPYARSDRGRYMHRVITRCPSSYRVDHQDCDGLNNQRPNLRICTFSQNNANRHGWALSGYKGVYREGSSCRARMTVDGVQIHIGTFKSEIEAAQAYDDKQYERFGEFAYLNFPDRYPPLNHTKPALVLPGF